MNICSSTLLFSGLFFFITYFIKRKSSKYSFIKLVLVALSAVLFFYIMLLRLNIAIFYSEAPFQDYKFTMQTGATYIPFLLLLLIIPVIRFNLKIFKEKSWWFISKLLFTFTKITYLTLMILFTYWGLYTIFS